MNNTPDFIRQFRSTLRILEREIDLELKSETGCCGVSLAQCHILMEIAESPNLSISELSENFGLDKSTLSRTVDSMVESGLILRKESQGDRRAVELTLTPEGMQRVESIHALCDRYYTALFGNIADDKHSAIVESVRLLGESMRMLRKKKNGKGCCSL